MYGGDVLIHVLYVSVQNKILYAHKLSPCIHNSSLEGPTELKFVPLCSS